MPKNCSKLRSAAVTIDEPVSKREREDRLIQSALELIERRARKPGILFNDSTMAGDWFRLRMAEYESEVFAVAWLDYGHRLIEFRELFFGSVHGTTIHLREVAKSALACNAAAAIFAHNHPSGCTEPSDLDIDLTIQLEEALIVFDVQVLDHFVVTASTVRSTILRARRTSRVRR